MPKTFCKKFEKTIEAGKSLKVTFPGSKFVVKAASADFDAQFDDGETSTLDAAGCELDFGGDYFRKVEIKNLSSTVALTVEFFIGDAGAKFTGLRFPRTKTIGHDLTIANNAESATIPGVATTAAIYSASGIGVGRRRDHLILTCKPAMTGKIWVKNATTGALLALVGAGSAGGGIPIKTDDDVKLFNDTGAGIQTSGATPDFAYMEVFNI